MAIAGDVHDRSSIRSSVLSGFAEFVESRNGNPIDLIEQVRIDPRALGAPDMLVSFTRVGMLLEHAARKLGIAALGLEWALGIPAHFPNLGPTLLLKEATATFEEWIERVDTILEHSDECHLSSAGSRHQPRHCLASDRLQMAAGNVAAADGTYSGNARAPRTGSPSGWKVEPRQGLLPARAAGGHRHARSPLPLPGRVWCLPR